jgi:hypothetical protein
MTITVHKKDAKSKVRKVKSLNITGFLDSADFNENTVTGNDVVFCGFREFWDEGRE